MIENPMEEFFTLITNMITSIAEDKSSWRDKKPDTSNYLEEKLNDKSIEEIICLIRKEYTKKSKLVSFFQYALTFFAFFAR